MEKNMRRNPLFKKLRGYQKAPRERFLLLLNKVLTHEEFILYEVGISLTDWDGTHTETYGTFSATNKEIAEILGWGSDSTVSRHKNSLLKKGFFLILDDNRVKPKDFESWELRKTRAKIQSTPSNSQTPLANMQTLSAEKHENRSPLNDYSLVSSKGDLGVPTIDLDESLSDEELEKISNDLNSAVVQKNIDEKEDGNVD